MNGLKVGDNLSMEKRRELKKLVGCFSSIFSDRPFVNSGGALHRDDIFNTCTTMPVSNILCKRQTILRQDRADGLFGNHQKEQLFLLVPGRCGKEQRRLYSHMH
ncbi:hypothetical protein PoB_002058100 [Plakobranchus ocellatus]|uniref:Uncharacterized protein n=1 Tax=Plakobranchus ocellatus TaxID=259542 RepID=A0AAV3ZHF6_9GAST|nr:hypothetical protein PoB_002058100 [Plakobranchus ocellatus]